MNQLMSCECGRRLPPSSKWSGKFAGRPIAATTAICAPEAGNSVATSTGKAAGSCCRRRPGLWLPLLSTSVDASPWELPKKLSITALPRTSTFPQKRGKKRGFRGFLWKNRGNLKHESSKKHANFPLFRKKTAAFGNHLLKKKKVRFQ